MNWTPSESCLEQLTAMGIPTEYVKSLKVEEPQQSDEQFKAFVIWSWKSSGGSAFQSAIPAEQEAYPLPKDWAPDEETYERLEKHLGFQRIFCEYCLIDFVNYWTERGDKSRTWTTRFIQHVKHQKQYYFHMMDRIPRPTLIPIDWQPAAEVFVILKKSNIDVDFAIDCIQEFVMYWHDSQRSQFSWNTTFLQHVRKRWTERHLQDKPIREMTMEDRFSTDWANQSSIFDSPSSSN